MRRPFGCVTGLVLTVLLSAGVAQARSVGRILTIDLRGITLGAVSGEFEWRAGASASRSLQGLHWRKTAQDGDPTEWDASAVAFGARSYLSGEVFSGLYVGVYGTASSIRVSSPQEATATSIGIAGAMGFRRVWGKLALDVGASLGVPITTHVVAPEMELDEHVRFNTGGASLTVGLGYAW